MSTATTTAKQKLYQIQVFHYPVEHGERWKAAVEGLPVQAEGDSREAVMEQVQQQLTAALTNGETVSLALNGTGAASESAPEPSLVGRVGDPNPPPISEEELAEIVARLLARGYVGIGVFANDPGAFDLFDEIERQRDQRMFGGE